MKFGIVLVPFLALQHGLNWGSVDQENETKEKTEMTCVHVKLFVLPQCGSQKVSAQTGRDVACD